jgi:thioredoxin 1
MCGMNPVVLDIACLCAAWCGTCTAYETTFAELTAAWPGHRLRWIDIEDEAELVGDIDVETFPTLLVAHAGQVLFAGPVLPRLSDAQRLLEAQLDGLAQGRLTPLTLSDEQQKAYAVLAQALAVPGG